MAIEVELKAWVEDPQTLAARLSEVATAAGQTHRYDIYFRPSDRPRPYLRLRIEGDTFTVTTKQRRFQNNMEINQELEYEASDPQVFCQFMETFDFIPFAVKRKHTDVYKAGRVTLELSHVEHLGHFIEIEILCTDESQVEAAQQELAHWMERLGIPDDSVEPTPYTRLLRERHPARYVYDTANPDTLVREAFAPDDTLQQRLL